MKKAETDFEELETSEEMQSRGLKRISRPKFLDKIPRNVQLRDCKSRITMDVDADIVEYFKQQADGQDAGYQTLINKVLREFVDERRESSTKKSFKRELKEALV